jgi:hypothetical protein
MGPEEVQKRLHEATGDPSIDEEWEGKKSTTGNN